MQSETTVLGELVAHITVSTNVAEQRPNRVAGSSLPNYRAHGRCADNTTK